MDPVVTIRPVDLSSNPQGYSGQDFDINKRGGGRFRGCVSLSHFAIVLYFDQTRTDLYVHV